MNHIAGPNRKHRQPARPRYRSLALSLSLSLFSMGSHAQIAPAALGGTSPESAPSALSPESDPYYSLQRQIELGEFVPAINNLEQQIRGIETTQHRYHTDLIKPLTLLGDALHGAENYPAALDAYGRAIHLTRVNNGLHSAEQVAGVYREAKVYRSAGDMQQANDREEYAWQVLQKTHGRYSPKLLPGIHHLAAWYGLTNNVVAARGLYMRAIRIVEANYDDKHPEMVVALRGLAQTYRLERFPRTYLNNASADTSTVTPNSPYMEDSSAVLLNRFPQGEKALKRVVQIQQAKLALLESKIVSTEEVKEEREVDGAAATSANTTTKGLEEVRQSTGVNPADAEALAQARRKVIAAVVELGDWFLLFDRSRVAMQYYTQAEAINNTLSSSQTKLDFSRPQLLHFPAPRDPRPPKPRYRGERKEGFVELKYTITVRGSIANLETTDSAPKGLMDYRVRKSMLSARYRPTFVNGAPVSTPEHTYRHQFSYYPSKPDPTAVPETQSPVDPVAPGTPTAGVETTSSATLSSQ